MWWPSRWQSQDYQKALEAHLKNENPLTPFFVRWKTQLDYSVFWDLPHNNILRGYNYYLYTKTGCESTAGKNYLGRQAIEDKARKLRFIQDYYAERGIPWLVWMPPAKSTIIPEYRPAFYQNYPVDTTNRQVFREVFQEMDIQFMDFEDFHELSVSSNYPMYSPGGLHWSYYSMGLAVDRLKNYFDPLLEQPLPLVQWQDSIEMSEDHLGPDKELVLGANQWEATRIPPMPYPKIRYQTDSLHQQAAALVVGDSYYKLMYDYGIHQGLFDDSSRFWYYNHEIHPPLSRDGQKLGINDLDLLKELESRDLVLIVVYEANLERFAFNFIENTYSALKKEE